MDTKILEDIGLTRLEAKVYLVMIDLGSSLAGKISAVANLHRRTVYDILERLVEKGLVRYIRKNNRKWYECVEPTRLMSLMADRQNRLKEIIPDLEAKYSFVKEKQETVFLKGKSAMKGLLSDQLAAKEILVLGASAEADKVVKYFFPHYEKERIRRKIRMKVLLNDDYRQKMPSAQVKRLPEMFSSNVAINIWDDKTAIILWKEEPMAIMIKNKDYSEGFRKYFELMWQCSK
jgi:sugar-specific transcriptional regulator TrmB